MLSLVAIIWILSPALIDSYLLPILNIQEADIGGLYTAVAALFSALAFAGILLTLMLQSKQLKLQEKEIDSQRKQASTNTEIAAYTALLTYYSNNSYEPSACELTSMDIAKRLNSLLGSPSRVSSDPE
jgi:hypothetical protein